jgi:diguanylate cyclase (GGDEF)-like protein
MAEAAGRALLAREFAETVASDAPLESLWPRCATTLAQLAGASSVTVVLRHDGRDAVAYHLERAAAPSGSAPVSIAIRRSDSLLGSIELAGTDCDAEQAALLDACAFALAVRLDHAFTDAITGLANRRSFETALTRAWSTAGRDQAPLSIVLFEVDASDRECLQRVAGALGGCVGRPSDVVARYGGATFVALFVNTSSSRAAELAERMRDAATLAAGVPVNVGTASRVPNRQWQPGDLLHAARAALEEVRVG